MTGRFSHLDFDDAPEPVRPKPVPFMGPTWTEVDRQRTAQMFQQQPPRSARYALNVGRGTFSWVDPQPPLWSLQPADTPWVPVTLTSSRIEYDVSWRKGLMDPFAQFGEFEVRLGVRHDSPPSAWEYQQVRFSQEALMALSGEIPILQKTFASRRSIVVALDPKAKTSNFVRVYVEIEAQAF